MFFCSTLSQSFFKKITLSLIKIYWFLQKSVLMGLFGSQFIKKQFVKRSVTFFFCFLFVFMYLDR